jgi:hypothetical protein
MNGERNANGIGERLPLAASDADRWREGVEAWRLLMRIGGAKGSRVGVFGSEPSMGRGRGLASSVLFTQCQGSTVAASDRSYRSLCKENVAADKDANSSTEKGGFVGH